MTSEAMPKSMPNINDLVTNDPNPAARARELANQLQEQVGNNADQLGRALAQLRLATDSYAVQSARAWPEEHGVAIDASRQSYEQARRLVDSLRSERHTLLLHWAQARAQVRLHPLVQD